ncbi:MAG: hypothetical protein NVSMB34_06120 [Variovorax sp.]
MLAPRCFGPAATAEHPLIDKVDRDFVFLLNAYDVEPGSATPKIMTMLDFNLWNRRIFPDIDSLNVRLNDKVRIRLDNASDFRRTTRTVERPGPNSPDPPSSHTVLKESETPDSEVVSILCCPKALRRLVPCVLPAASTQEQVPCRWALRVVCLSGRAAG